MAAPPVPSLRTLVTEALDRAGYANPSEARLQRAERHWMEETKQDIWRKSKKLKSLYTSSVAICTENQGRYPFPPDFASDLSVVLLHGTTRGTAQSGANAAITLASTEDVTQESILGKEILIYDGIAKANISQCTAYNTTTKVATVTPAWTTQPDSTSLYMIVDIYYPLKQNPIWNTDRNNYQTTRGTPFEYYPIGDSDSGEFILYPVPHHISDIPFGMKLRYYANLLRVDLDSTLMATLYRDWMGELMQGVFVRALQDLDDVRYREEKQIYMNMINLLVATETYGLDLHNMQATVET
jgi:hypothetical protein